MWPDFVYFGDPGLPAETALLQGVFDVAGQPLRIDQYLLDQKTKNDLSGQLMTSWIPMTI